MVFKFFLAGTDIHLQKTMFSRYRRLSSYKDDYYLWQRNIICSGCMSSATDENHLESFAIIRVSYLMIRLLHIIIIHHGWILSVTDEHWLLKITIPPQGITYISDDNSAIGDDNLLLHIYILYFILHIIFYKFVIK